MIAIDVESSGLDLRHSSRPFFVSVCRGDGTQTWWEWPVDPYTREVRVPPEDTIELNAVVRDADELVGHNVKFDATALAAVGVGPWPWEKTHDTMLLAHLLASSMLKDLTALAATWLGEDVKPLETALRDAVVECRRLVNHKAFAERHGEWKVARDDDPGLPSGGGWGADYWLPKAYYLVAHHEQDHIDHTFATVLRDYSLADTAVTLALYRVLAAEAKRRDRWALYEERRKLLRVSAAMEANGLTYDLARTAALRKRLRRESVEYARKCHAVCAKYDYQLEFPKGASPNGSVRRFCFDVLGLKPVRNPKAKTDAPSLDSKTAIPHYLMTLPEGTDQGDFVRALVGKRSRDTGLAFLDAWDLYALPLVENEELAVLPTSAAFPIIGEIQPTQFRRHSRSHKLIHASFNPAFTDTLRFSSSNPNAQQIGKKDTDANGLPIAVLRSCFGPAPGREWWSLDFANIELRIPAYLSRERDLIDLFERADEPPYYGSEHILNFSVVYPDLWAQAVAEAGLEKAAKYVKDVWKGSWYKDCKNGDFAVGYGAGDETADRTFRRKGSRRRLLERFAKKEEKVAEAIRFAEKHGYVETLPDRTVDPRRGYPLMCIRTEYGRVKPTLPWNYKVQGTAGWVGNRAAVRCLEALDDWNRKAGGDVYRMPAYVHDELVFDFPKAAHPLKEPRGSNLGRIREIKALMERGGQDLIPTVPALVSVEFHESNWAEGLAVKL